MVSNKKIIMKDVVDKSFFYALKSKKFDKMSWMWYNLNELKSGGKKWKMI